VRKLLKLLIPLLILSLGIAVFSTLRATRPEQPTAQIEERIWRVEVEPVDLQTLAPQLVLYGQVETPDLLKAAAPRTARVAAVAVREGGRVTAGSLLVRLDERDFLPALHQAEARVAELESQLESERIRHENDVLALEQDRRLLELARNGVERAQRLKKQRVGSESDLDAALEALARQTLAVSNRERDIADHPARLGALEARLRSARAQLAEIQLDLERSSIIAPFDGVVTGVDVAVGNQVMDGEVLLRLYSLEDLEVRARIPAPYQFEIANALADGMILEAETVSGDAEIRLTLERLSGEAQPSGVDGLFAVTTGSDALRLGQMLELRLERPPRKGVVPMPFEAVYGGDRLYKLEQGRMRGIRVEALGGWSPVDGDERLLVRSPYLTSGDLVVVTHMPNAVDGLRVEAVQ
jgi:multidrug efflux pump subunit AcrA (membrane-fusion protein)